MTVTVDPNAPVAVADAATTHPNQRVDIYVAGNDTDADGDQLSPEAVVVAPTNGEALVFGSVIVYEPNDGFAGTDTFTYRVTDGAGTSDATVTVTTRGGSVVAQ